jgi:hypothetical protein
MTKNRAVLAVAAVALLALAGCGSMNDVLGTGNSNPNGSYSNQIRGTVESVDLNNHSILLTNTSGYNSMLSSSGSNGNAVRIYYDNNTRVQYQGQNYRPEDLDRGDQVDVRVNESGNRLIADTMTVTYNASTASSTYPGTNNSMVSGTVRNVNTSRRTIEVDPGYGNTVVIDYDPNTSVSYGGRTYAPGDLERGDRVDIRVRDIGGGRLMAQSVDVTRSVSSTNNNGTYGNSNMSTIRGTVRYVDTASHTIQLEQTNWISGFNTNTNTSGSTMTIQYDPSLRVDVSGQLYPITNLERGDQVEVQTQGNFAQRISLIRDVRR